MRIAIFHDYIGAIGGGEKLVLTLARGLGADVITTDVDEDSVKKMGFEDVVKLCGKNPEAVHVEPRDNKAFAGERGEGGEDHFCAEYSSEDGLKETVKWYRESLLRK